MAHLRRFLIEHDIDGVGGLSIVELCGAARASEDLIRKHAELSAIPIARIVEVPHIIDPLTANN
jgi:hypothetical protein